MAKKSHVKFVILPRVGHAVMDQYPDKINKVLQTFLSTTTG
jgi:pimeloyl-ACP methyl ester carboxylesterase